MPRLRARGCTRAVAVALGAAFCATLACASAPDTALHLLAVWLFFVDGIWCTTTANLLMEHQWTFGASRCHSELPMASWVRGRLESRLTASAPPRQADPVVEQPAGAACSNALGSAAGWHTPWVMRSGRKLSTEMSAEWIVVHHTRGLLNATAVNMADYSAEWEHIADCPAKRKQFHKEHSLSEVLANQSALYAAFDEGFLDANKKQFRELWSHMLALRGFCDFQGFGVLRIRKHRGHHTICAPKAIYGGHAVSRRHLLQPVLAGSRGKNLDPRRALVQPVYAADTRGTVRKRRWSVRGLAQADAPASYLAAAPADGHLEAGRRLVHPVVVVARGGARDGGLLARGQHAWHGHARQMVPLAGAAFHPVPERWPVVCRPARTRFGAQRCVPIWGCG